jgi:transcriptional antiterminator Rof (Rho-off)
MGEHNLARAIQQSAKDLFDSVIHSDLFKRIPVVGPAIEVCETVDDVRARMFARKLVGFLQPLDQMTPEARKKFTEKMAESQEGMQKAGETLLLVLDKITALEKAEIIAYVFITYTQGGMEEADFRRLADAIDHAFIDDLKELLDAQKTGRSQASYMKHLERTGLTFADLNKIPRNREYHHYVVSDLGKQLIAAYSAGVQYCRTSK